MIGFDEEWLVPILGQINNEYFYVLLCVNLKGLVVKDEENMMKIWPGGK